MRYLLGCEGTQWRQESNAYFFMTSSKVMILVFKLFSSEYKLVNSPATEIKRMYNDILTSANDFVHNAQQAINLPINLVEKN